MVFAVASRVLHGSKKRNKRRTLSKKTRLKGLVGGSENDVIYVIGDDHLIPNDLNKTYYTIYYLKIDSSIEVRQKRNVWFALDVNPNPKLNSKVVKAYQQQSQSENKFCVSLVIDMIGFKRQDGLLDLSDKIIKTDYKPNFWETEEGISIIRDGVHPLSEYNGNYTFDKQKIDAIIVYANPNAPDTIMQINRGTASIEPRTPKEAQPQPQPQPQSTKSRKTQSRKTQSPKTRSMSILSIFDWR
jgi:hypothetical protein